MTDEPKLEDVKYRILTVLDRLVEGSCLGYKGTWAQFEQEACQGIEDLRGDLRDARAEVERLREEGNGLVARIIVWSLNDERLRAALALPLMFYAGGPWLESRAKKWLEITGESEATTRIMCDHIRKALALEPTTDGEAAAD